MKVWTVTRSVTTGAAAEAHSVTYAYTGGMFDSPTKEFRGFASVTATNEQSGMVSKSDFWQDLILQGRPQYSETRLANGTLIKSNSTTWASIGDYPNGAGQDQRHFPYISASVESNYDVDGTLLVQSTINNTFDTYGNATSITESKNDGSSRVVTNTYSNDVANWLLGRLTLASVTSTAPGQTAKTRTSSFAYDATGLLRQETIEPNDPALTQTTTHTYDSFGNRLTLTVSGNGVAPRTTTVEYDANGLFPISTTNAAGHSESYVWDARFGVKTSLTGPNGLTTTWSYDGFGRKIGEVRADGTSTTIIHHMDVAPLYVSSQSTGLPAKTVYYDSLGRKTRTQSTAFNGGVIYADTEYNALGQVSRKSAPYAVPGTPKWTTYVYDAIGRVTSETRPDDSTTTTSYNGLTKSVTNAKLQNRTEIKDVYGRVYQVIDSMNGTLTYTYDPFGNLTATTDAAGHIVSMSYDLRGRKIGMSDPDMGVWAYSYNAFGELVSQTNARGQTATMTYDALGRMLSRTEPEGVGLWTYDVGTKAIGKLSSEGIPNIYSRIYDYDGLGRPLSTLTSVGGTNYIMGTSYDANGRVDTITYPTGFAVKRVYNAQGYLSQVQNAANAAEVFWTANAVDAEGHVLMETLGNGLSTVRQYNQLTNRLEAITAGPNANGSIQNLSFSHDVVGNLRSRSDNVLGWTENFSYDELNRITGVAGPANKTYAYDAIGKRSRCLVLLRGLNGQPEFRGCKLRLASAPVMPANKILARIFALNHLC